MNYHPDIELLLHYSNGQLAPALAISVALHHQQCEKCQLQVSDIESLAGDSLEHIDNAELTEFSFDKLMEQLDPFPLEQTEIKVLQDVRGDSIEDYQQLAIAASDLSLLKLLHQQDFSQTQWKKITGKIAQSRIDLNDTSHQVELLKFKPHAKIPKHTHQGNEFTVVVQGSFSDHLGEYQVGEFIAANKNIEHQPQAGPDGCICLAVTDKPLKFTGLLGPIINWIAR